MAQILAKTRRRLPAAARREHLLDIAADILLDQGFEALTMEAVKLRAKVSRGLAYVHFANAEELALALYEREADELDRRIAAATSSPGSFEQRVRAAMRAYLDFAGERGGLMALLQIKLSGRWSQPSVMEKLGRRFQFWSGAMVRDLGLSEAFAGALARASVAAVEQIAAAWRIKKLTREQAEEMSVAFALGGLHAAIAAVGPSHKKAH